MNCTVKSELNVEIPNLFLSFVLLRPSDHTTCRPGDHKMSARIAVHSHLTCDSSSLSSLFLYPSLHYNDHFFLVHTYRTCTCVQETFSDRFTKMTISSLHKPVLFKEGDLLTFCMVGRTVNRYTHHAQKYKVFHSTRL